MPRRRGGASRNNAARAPRASVGSGLDVYLLWILVIVLLLWRWSSGAAARSAMPPTSHLEKQAAAAADSRQRRHHRLFCHEISRVLVEVRQQQTAHGTPVAGGPVIDAALAPSRAALERLARPAKAAATTTTTAAAAAAAAASARDRLQRARAAFALALLHLHRAASVGGLNEAEGLADAQRSLVRAGTLLQVPRDATYTQSIWSAGMAASGATEHGSAARETTLAVLRTRGYIHEARGEFAASQRAMRLAGAFDAHGVVEDALFPPAGYTVAGTLRTHAIAPFFVDLLLHDELLTLFRRCDGGASQPAPRSHSPYEDGVVVDGGGWGTAEARAAFHANEFVILRKLLHPFEQTTVAAFYASIVAARNGRLPGGVNTINSTSAGASAGAGTGAVALEPDAARTVAIIGAMKHAPSLQPLHEPHLQRTSLYNDRIGLWLNAKLVPFLEKVVGEELKKAYSFLCSYEQFDAEKEKEPWLQAHTDREDNAFTVSLQLYNGGFDWPIFVDTSASLPLHAQWREMPAKGAAPQHCANGDALLFRGRKHIHWREQLPAHVKRFATILFHFVPKSFDLVEYKQRQQKTPGI